MDSNSDNTFCWLFYEGIDLSNIRVENGVTHALLIDRCPSCE